MRIREETPADRAAIHRVNALAFEGEDEATIVDALRAAGALILSIVAVDDNGEVVGHILFSPVTLRTAADTHEGVGLAPMAVRPDAQRRGIGSALVREGLRRLQAAGHPFVVVLGHPEYYPRFGFRRASTFGVRWEHDAPDEAFMALELRPGSLAGKGGVVAYRPELGGA